MVFPQIGNFGSQTRTRLCLGRGWLTSVSGGPSRNTSKGITAHGRTWIVRWRQRRVRSERMSTEQSLEGDIIPGESRKMGSLRQVHFAARAPRTVPGNGKRTEGQAAVQRELLHETKVVEAMPPRWRDLQGHRCSADRVGGSRSCDQRLGQPSGQGRQDTYPTCSGGVMLPPQGVVIRASGKTLPGGAHPKRTGMSGSPLARDESANPARAGSWDEVRSSLPGLTFG